MLRATGYMLSARNETAVGAIPVLIIKIARVISGIVMVNWLAINTQGCPKEVTRRPAGDIMLRATGYMLSARNETAVGVIPILIIKIARVISGTKMEI
ncbi:MAG: hypothetical protein L0Y68_02575 [Candidatus Dadabacteria bacterium]|nr:hypothetical protein [Candidatus Dadabacteria bacterium]